MSNVHIVIAYYNNIMNLAFSTRIIVIYLSISFQNRNGGYVIFGSILNYLSHSDKSRYGQSGKTILAHIIIYNHTNHNAPCNLLVKRKWETVLQERSNIHPIRSHGFLSQTYNHHDRHQVLLLKLKR